MNTGLDAEILEAFVAESADNLKAIEASIADLEAGRAGAIDELFRAVHTLKGSASIVGLARLESFAHAFESRLSSLRAGKASLGRDAPGALLACRDHLAALLSSAGLPGASGPSSAAHPTAEAAALLDLDRALGLAPAAPAAAREPAVAPESDAPSGADVLEPPASRNASTSGGHSRVANRKLDALLEEASELSQALSELGAHLKAAGLSEFGDELMGLHNLASRHYRTILEARTEPFGLVAEPYRRSVEEIARESGKEIDFIVLGSETEIDRAIADRLAEPLLHLVRNAADHGVEAPEARLAAGKGRSGRIALSARREAGYLVVRVEDDGRGIDPAAVRARAEEEGIAIPSGAQASDEELLSLLALPGFSLSRKVTKWSGRGVGLDAVERSLRQARGSLRLESVPGALFAAEIRVPLALSLVEGFTARAGEASLLVPFEAVSSCESFADEELEAASLYRTVAIGGRLLPAVDLSLLYGSRGESRRIAIVLHPKNAGASIGEASAALLVDSVGEALSAAVRPLDRRFADSPGLAGLSALGDGSLVLALDAAELLRMALAHA